MSDVVERLRDPMMDLENPPSFTELRDVYCEQCDEILALRARVAELEALVSSIVRDADALGHYDILTDYDQGRADAVHATADRARSLLSPADPAKDQ